MITTTDVVNAINRKTKRGAWERGVQKYAVDLALSVGDVISDWEPYTWRDLEKIALNGARDWYEYSYGGCAFIYGTEICERLCSPSEVKRTRHGELAPNADETWLDVQARALEQAWDYVEFVCHYYLGMPLC